MTAMHRIIFAVKNVHKIFNIILFLHLASVWFKMTTTKRVVFVAPSPSQVARQRKGTILLYEK